MVQNTDIWRLPVLVKHILFDTPHYGKDVEEYIDLKRVLSPKIYLENAFKDLN